MGKGEAGYDKPTWVYTDAILCVIPPPDMVCSSRSVKMYIPEGVVDTVKKR